MTHDRYFLDEVAGWILELDRGKGIPYEGNYTGWLEQKQKRLEQEGKPGGGAPAHPGARARMGAAERRAPARPRARRASPPTRRWSPQSREKAPDTAQIVLPPGPRLGDLVIEAEHLARPMATGC